MSESNEDVFSVALNLHLEHELILSELILKTSYILGIIILIHVPKVQLNWDLMILQWLSA